MAMEESTLYLWCLNETRDTVLGHKTRFPAKSTPLSELTPGMELGELFENEYIHDSLGPLKVEEAGKDSVTIIYRDERFTLRRGERYTTSMHRTGNSYMSEYIGIEAELC